MTAGFSTLTKIPGRTLASILLLLVTVAVLYYRYPGSERKHLYYGLTVAGCLVVLEVAFRALIRWRYDDSSTAKGLSRVVTLIWWFAFIVIMAVF
jgi:hypothetical protein